VLLFWIDWQTQPSHPKATVPAKSNISNHLISGTSTSRFQANHQEKIGAKSCQLCQILPRFSFYRYFFIFHYKLFFGQDLALLARFGTAFFSLLWLIPCILYCFFCERKRIIYIERIYFYLFIYIVARIKFTFVKYKNKDIYEIYKKYFPAAYSIFALQVLVLPIPWFWR
jgi:hypothetical protein